MSNLTRPTDEFDQKVIAKFLETHPEWNDPESFEVSVTSSISPSAVKSVRNALAAGKFSGRYGKISDIGQVLLFTLSVKMKNLPNTAANNIALSERYCVNNFQSVATIEDVQNWLRTITEIIKEDRVERSKENTKANLSFWGMMSSNKPREERVALELPVEEANKENSADKRFYRIWATDSTGTLFMKYYDSYIIVPIKTSKDIDSALFWGKFWECHEGLTNIIDQKSTDILWDAWTSKEDPAKSLRPYVPAELYPYLSVVGTIQTEVDKEGNTKEYMASIRLKIRPFGHANEVPEPLGKKSWQAAIAHALCDIDPRKLVKIRTLSNNMDEPALFNVDLKPLEPAATDIPDLPKTWDKFFDTKLGDNKSSQLYRIAKWVVSCFDQWNVNRNVLIIAGHGNDGKSMFTDVVTKGFNMLVGKEDFAMTLPAVAVESSKSQVGLAKCMSSRVLITPDVSKITSWLNSEVVKQITGCDEVTADIKYQVPITRKMTGVKLMATTNYPIYLSDDHSISRTYPIVFNRSESEPNWDVYKMKNLMLEEFEDWVKWCFAFAYAQDDALGITHKNPAPIYSDSVPTDVPFGNKQHWDAIGTEDGSEPMFRYRAFDEQSDMDEESILYLLGNCTQRGGKVKNVELRTELIRLSREMNQQGLAKLIETSNGYKILSRAIRSLYPESEPFQSHGERGWKGFSVNNRAMEERIERKKIQRSSTTLPAGV